jgi:hypothetical protein
VSCFNNRVFSASITSARARLSASFFAFEVTCRVELNVEGTVLSMELFMVAILDFMRASFSARIKSVNDTTAAGFFAAGFGGADMLRMQTPQRYDSVEG